MRVRGARPPPFSLLPSRTKLQCTLLLCGQCGQIYSSCFLSINICTLWFNQREIRGLEDPDPCQNVTDPEHWLVGTSWSKNANYISWNSLFKVHLSAPADQIAFTNPFLSRNIKKSEECVAYKQNLKTRAATISEGVACSQCCSIL